MYIAEIARIVADLQIEDLHIEWQWVNKSYLEKKRRGVVTLGTHHQGFGNKHIIRIALNNPYQTVITTIAHELRHAWQFARTVCEFKLVDIRGRHKDGRQKQGYRYVWAGTNYHAARPAYDRAIRYWNRPEEVDARGYENDAWTRLFEQDTKLRLASGKAPRRDTPRSVVAAMFAAALD